MRLVLFILVILAVASAGWYTSTQLTSHSTTTAQHTPPPVADVVIESATLENGLEIVVVPNDRVPAVSHILWVKAGAIDEAPGASGVAHYLEHLLFKGTPTTPAGEYSQKIVSLGGNHNAFTGQDFTGYYVNIAKEHLETVMALEADRIANIAPSDVDYEKERSVILEERKTRIDSKPEALFSEQMSAQLFVHHPYGTPIIGWKHEMETLGKAQAEAFLHRFYTPDNMVLVLAGDVTLAQALPLAKKYYGSLQGTAQARQMLTEPPQLGDKFFRMQHPQVRQARWNRIYKVPSMVYGAPAHAMPLMLLSEWLGGDSSSYLYKKLVIEQKLATHISLNYDALRLGPGTLSLSAIPAEGVSLDELGTAIDAAIATLDPTEITEEGLAPHKTQAIASTLFARDSLQGLGQFVGYMRMLGLPDNLLNNWGQQIENLTPAELLCALPYITRPVGTVTGHLSPAKKHGDDDA